MFAPLTSSAELRASSVTSTELARFSALVSDKFLANWLIFCLFSGAFGEVRMCVHRESGAQRAVKVLRKSHMDDDEKRMLFNEINILKEIVSRSWPDAPKKN